jgi:hypothetical protein
MKRAPTPHAIAALLALIVGSFCSSNASAQLALDQYTIAGGGGVSSGGAYAVAGSVGDPSTGDLTGGDFTVSGGQLDPPPPDDTCVADLALPSGVLDFSDIIAFLSAFSAMEPAADLADPVGQFDFSDVVAFLSAFAAGCP